MPPQPLFQLSYRSVFQLGRVDSPLTTLRDIVKQSRARNAASGVTGFMAFDGLGFLQVLEGPEDAVRETYERIGRDRRHRDVTLLGTRSIERRDFPDWHMEGYLGRDRDRETIRRHGGDGVSLAGVPSGSVLALLKDIAQGPAERI